jgi:hypothetical protein
MSVYPLGTSPAAPHRSAGAVVNHDAPDPHDTAQPTPRSESPRRLYIVGGGDRRRAKPQFSHGPAAKKPVLC